MTKLRLLLVSPLLQSLRRAISFNLLLLQSRLPMPGKRIWARLEIILQPDLPLAYTLAKETQVEFADEKSSVRRAKE